MVNMGIGILLGFLSGLGTGGGSLLILWLTFCQGMAQEETKVVNLMFFIPSAAIACIFRWKQGCLDMKKMLPAMIAGSIMAGIFAYFGNQWNAGFLKKAFGGLLIFTGIRELLYRPKQN